MIFLGPSGGICFTNTCRLRGSSSLRGARAHRSELRYLRGTGVRRPLADTSHASGYGAPSRLDALDWASAGAPSGFGPSVATSGASRGSPSRGSGLPVSPESRDPAPSRPTPSRPASLGPDSGPDAASARPASDDTGMHCVPSGDSACPDMHSTAHSFASSQTAIPLGGGAGQASQPAFPHPINGCRLMQSPAHRFWSTPHGQSGHATTLPHPSLAIPHRVTSLQVRFGWHVPAPHTFGLWAPQTVPVAHAPQ